MLFVASEQKPPCNYQRQNTSKTATKTCKKLDNIISKPSGNKKVTCHKYYSNKSRICGNRFLMEPPVPSPHLAATNLNLLWTLAHWLVETTYKGLPW